MALAARLRLRRGRDGERGAAAVEAALILPLLIVLLFGIFEVALLVNDNLLLSQAARSAVRTAVALPRDPGFDAEAATAASGVLGVDTSGDIEQLIIYRADPATGRPAGGGSAVDCFTDCIRYTWSPTAERFERVAGTTWDASTQMACGGRDATDFVGVEIRGRHEWATGVFGDGVQLVERAVMRLEPVLAGSCGRSV
ncbi:MAG: hypothetical protein GEV08_21765 [Acidimicrobiia bacterium]|nr:hypothetical protein [Acidimicrobiia bacterium]